MEESNAPEGFTMKIGGYRYSLFARDFSQGVMFLYDTTGKQIARLSFENDGGARPPSTLENGIVNMTYDLSRLPDILSFLRNEPDRLVVWVDGINSRLSSGI